MIGSTGAPYIRAGFITSPDSSILITNGPGTIKLQAGGGIATTYVTDAGSTTPVSNLLTLIGAGGVTTSVGPAGTITITGTPGGVTSIIGTANQIAASSPTGAVTLSLVGPYTPDTYTAHGVLIGEGTSSIVALGAGTAGQVLQSSGAGVDPAYSTTTYPSTTTVSEILYSSASNVVSGLATGNDGVLITSHTGVPSWLPNGTTGQVLTATTGAPPSWAAPSGGGTNIGDIITQVYQGMGA